MWAGMATTVHCGSGVEDRPPEVSDGHHVCLRRPGGVPWESNENSLMEEKLLFTDGATGAEMTWFLRQPSVSAPELYI